MATVTVQNIVTDPSGNPMANISVSVYLVNGSTSPGYTTTTSVIWSDTTTTNASGFWSMPLVPNSTITPANTYYKVIEGNSYTSTIVVPASGGPYNLSGILTGVLPTPAATYIPTSAEGVAGGVATLDGTGNVPLAQLANAPGGTFSNTVVAATAFGQTSTAGVATSSSRGDHSHGTPSVSPLALPDTATPGAAPVAGLDLYSHNFNGQSVLRILTPENVEVDVVRDMIFVARNVTGATIPIGTPVYFSDVFTGGEVVPIVSLAQANNVATIAQGITWEAIPNNGYGRVSTKGRVFNLNTSAWTVNSVLYLSAATPGALTTTKPTPPNTAQPMAFVLRSHATLGELWVLTNTGDGNDLGTSSNSFQIGSGTAGTKTLVFTNGQTQTLQSVPSATRTILIPDASGTLSVDEPPYPSAGYGLLGMSADPMWCQNPAPPGTNITWYVRVYVPAGTAITNLWWAVRVAGTYDGVTSGNQIGLYTDAGVSVGATAVDNTLWTAIGWRGGAVVGGPIAAQNSGRFVYLVALARGMTGLNWAAPPNPNDVTAPFTATGVSQPNRRAAYATATALPASFDPTLIGTATGYLMLCGFN